MVSIKRIRPNVVNPKLKAKRLNGALLRIIHLEALKEVKIDYSEKCLNHIPQSI